MTYSADEIAEIDHRIAIFQACKDGRKVEWRFPGNPWGPLHSMPRIWDNIEYRIAPEPRAPRECYAVFSDGSEHVRMFAHRDRNEASAHYRVLAGDEVVHMREVLPD
jgi:hypothetical protein